MRVLENAKVFMHQDLHIFVWWRSLTRCPVALWTCCGTRTKLKQTWSVSYKGKVEPSPKRRFCVLSMKVKNRAFLYTRRVVLWVVLCWRTPLVSGAFSTVSFYTLPTIPYHDSTTVRHITLNILSHHLKTIFMPCHNTIHQPRHCQTVSTCCYYYFHVYLAS